MLYDYATVYYCTVERLNVFTRSSQRATASLNDRDVRVQDTECVGRLAAGKMMLLFYSYNSCLGSLHNSCYNQEDVV